MAPLEVKVGQIWEVSGKVGYEPAEVIEIDEVAGRAQLRYLGTGEQKPMLTLTMIAGIASGMFRLHRGAR